MVVFFDRQQCVGYADSYYCYLKLFLSARWMIGRLVVIFFHRQRWWVGYADKLYLLLEKWFCPFDGRSDGWWSSSSIGFVGTTAFSGAKNQGRGGKGSCLRERHGSGRRRQPSEKACFRSTLRLHSQWFQEAQKKNALWWRRRGFFTWTNAFFWWKSSEIVK